MAATGQSAHERQSTVETGNNAHQTTQVGRTTTEEDRKDNSIVDWDGPDDPENPRK